MKISQKLKLVFTIISAIITLILGFLVVVGLDTPLWGWVMLFLFTIPFIIFLIATIAFAVWYYEGKEKGGN